MTARGINISIGGLLCRTDEPVDPLTRMQMSLSLPDREGRERQLELEGTILHYRCEPEGGYALGIHFDSMGSSQRNVIGEYIASLNNEE